MNNNFIDLGTLETDLIFMPLDVPTDIPYNKILLTEWLDQNYKFLFKYKNKLSTAEEPLSGNYPWNLVPVYWDMFDDGPGWLNNFNIEFYDLKNWILDTFKLNEKDLGTIVFLRMRPNYSGWGFWHIDPDPFGLRVMLDVDITNEKLYVRKFKEKYIERPVLKTPLDDFTMHNELHECKILHPRQSHVLTYRLAGHATYNDIPGKERLCIQIVNKVEINSKLRFSKSVKNIVKKSLNKFKEYAIYY